MDEYYVRLVVEKKGEPFPVWEGPCLDTSGSLEQAAFNAGQISGTWIKSENNKQKQKQNET